MLLNRAPSSTQLHSRPLSSSQPLSTSIHLHPAHFSLYQLSPILSPFWLKTSTHGILEVLILNPDFDFWSSNVKIYFWASLGGKSQSYLLCQKIGTHGISQLLILIPTLVFWISNPKSIFGQISIENVKFVRFAWKLVHMASWGWWFLFWH